MLHILAYYWVKGNPSLEKGELYRACHKEDPSLWQPTFDMLLERQTKLGNLVVDGDRVMLAAAHQALNSAAQALAGRLKGCERDQAVLETDSKAALRIALNNPLSVILATREGPGEIFLVHASDACERIVICTLEHSAANRVLDFGLPLYNLWQLAGEKDMGPWRDAELVIVAEAEKLTAEAMEELLKRVPPTANVALMGDPNREENPLIGEFAKLGAKAVRLLPDWSLEEPAPIDINMANYHNICCADDFVVDGSNVMFLPMSPSWAGRMAAIEALDAHTRGQSFQLVTLSRNKTGLTKHWLAEQIHKRTYDPEDGSPAILCDDVLFQDGDRIRYRTTGDLGTLHLCEKDGEISASVSLGFLDVDITQEKLSNLFDSAWALTPEELEGQHFHSVALLMTKDMGPDLTRSGIYRAMAASDRLIIIGEREALDVALRHREVNPSELALMTEQYLHKEASK